MWARLIVITLFKSENARHAEVGPMDKNVGNPFGDMFSRWGVKTPGGNKPLDPMYYVVLDDHPIGYVRVFDDEHPARYWFSSLRDRTNFWAFWRDGRPLAWSEGANAKSANQFIDMMVMCRVRALSAGRAAESGFRDYMNGRLQAMEVYLDPVKHPDPLAPRPSPDTKAENIRTSSGDQWMVHVIQDSGWHTEEKHNVVRTYKITNMPSPIETASLTIEASLARWLNGKVGGYLHFNLQPIRCLWSERPKVDDGEIFSVPFYVGLVAAGSGKGTEASPIMQGGMFGVSASLGEDDTVRLDVIDTRDVMLGFKTLSLGKRLHFTIIDETDGAKLRVNLANDQEFQKLFDRVAQSI